MKIKTGVNTPTMLFLFLAVVLLLSAFTAQAEKGQAHWPDWRGPSADGRSDATGLPLKWSEENNIVWKTPIHDLGYSTPVVWGDQVWLTTATKDGQTLYAVCVDFKTGEVIHDVAVLQPEEPQRINPNNSYATPSATVEEGRVYVHYGTHGTACLDTETGEVLWRRSDLNCNHLQGPVASPLLYEDLLIVCLEGVDVQFFVALDKKTGKTVWRVDRRKELYDHLEPKWLRKSYHTPMIVEVDGEPQLIVIGAVSGTAHNPQTGEELWRVLYPADNPVARSVSGHGMLFFNTGGSPDECQMWAVRLGGRGDVTDTHVLWKITEDMPLASSPVLVADLLYTLSRRGALICLEAKTGKQVWSERLDGDYGASLLYADNRIYIVGKQGITTIIEPGRTFKKLAANQLAGFFGPSPAVVGQSLLLRSKTHLYRIENK